MNSLIEWGFQTHASELMVGPRMVALLASALFIATVVLFFLPDLVRGPFHHFLLIGVIVWFVISRWMKEEWKRHVEQIADRFCDPYERIREIGESRDFWQNYPRNLQRMDLFSQGDLGVWFINTLTSPGDKTIWYRH